MTIKYSREQKQQHIADWQQSGLSRRAYAVQHGINEATFYYWVEKNNEATSTETPRFIPARLAVPEEKVTVTLTGGIGITCHIAQLPHVIQVLQHVHR